MFKAILVLTLFSTILFAQNLREKIAQMLVVGFNGTTINETLENDISKLKIGGVILFGKNIKNKSQLKELTSSLKALNPNLFIAIDQEGGRVQRLSSKNGFRDFPSSAKVGELPSEKAFVYFNTMARELKEMGINLNFAPVVDLAVNPQNPVIFKLERSYGANTDRVISYADLFIKAMHKHHILTTLKHFPGHGSSTKDSHKGFVDVTKSWSEMELEPFLKCKSDLIMTAHIYNKKLDPNYPATLSRKTLLLLRKKGYENLIISDDLQMGAIRKNFDLNTTLTKAINGGVDLLLFGNQLAHPTSTKMLVDRVEKLVKNGAIQKDEIENSYRAIIRIKEKLD